MVAGPAALPDAAATAIRRFAHERDFLRGGAVISDVDGTLMPQGQTRFCQAVGTAIDAIATLRRPVVLNTLRTPDELRDILARSPLRRADAIPVVTLNGALSGMIHLRPAGGSVFEELHAHVLGEAEFDEAGAALHAIAQGTRHAAVLVAYHRDGRARPTVWHHGGVLAARRASLWNGDMREFATVAQLKEQLRREQICMLYVLDEVPEGAGGRGASRIVTAGGRNKQNGAEAVCDTLGLVLEHCIGSGDSALDAFLGVVGCGVHVGNAALPFRSRHTTIRVATPAHYGTLLQAFAAMHQPGHQPIATL